MRRRACYLLTFLACLSLAGCGPKVVYKYRIAVIPKGLTHEFWQSIRRGAERAAADLQAQGIAVQVLWDGPRKESDAREQIDLVHQKCGMGIHGLVLAPQHSKQMVPVVEQTVEKGIPVVVIDSALDPEALKQRPDLIVKYVATDNRAGGRLAAKRLLEVLAKKGKTAPKLILFRYAPGSESTEQREQGFLDRVKEEVEKQKKAGKSADERIKIVSDNIYAGATVGDAVSAAGPLLVRLGKEADGIFAVNESAATGMLNAMRSQGLEKKIALVAFDSSEQLLQAVREGDVEGLIVQDPYRMGYLGLWTLVQHLEGYTVSPGQPSISTGEYLLTRENLDSEESRQRFDREAQKRRTIAVPK